MSSGLDNYGRAGHTSELLSEARFGGAHRSFAENVALSVENAPMADLVSEINAYCLPRRFRRG